MTLAFSLGTGTASAREDIGRGDVVVIPLQGEVSESLALFIRRAEKTAESNGAKSPASSIMPPSRLTPT
jgi:hypothetical protein